MVKHIVAFKLNGTPQQRHDVAVRFRDALMALPEQISVLESMEVGINEILPKSGISYSRLWYRLWRMLMYMPNIRRMWMQRL